MKNHSKQRDLVYENLKKRDDHPTAEQIYMSIKNDYPNIGKATVYRNLNDLCNEGKAKRISSITGGADRFDGILAPHIHFECRSCGDILNIYLNDYQNNQIYGEVEHLTDEMGGLYEESQITITGYCKKCKQLKELKNQS